MKRRTFLQALSTFLAAPLAFFGAKEVVPLKPPIAKNVCVGASSLYQNYDYSRHNTEATTIIVPQSLYDTAVEIIGKDNISVPHRI